VVDTKSYMYLATVARRGPKPDDPDLLPAMRMATSNCKIKEILADAGYDAERHHRLLREVFSCTSIIPPNRGRPTPKLPTGRYRRMMVTDFPKKRFGQRWQIESCFSQDKRRFGSSIESRSYWSQCRSLLLRVLVHNLAIIKRVRNYLFNRAGQSLFFRPASSAPLTTVI
jgi:transposase